MYVTIHNYLNVVNYPLTQKIISGENQTMGKSLFPRLFKV
jgi:hypothetical protein